MQSTLTKTLLTPIKLLPDKAGHFFTGILTKNLQRQLLGEATDEFLELLLKGMDLAFFLSKGYRRNIKDFEGRYLFGTADGMVAVSAIFKDGDMRVSDDAVDDWDVKITFKDAPALLKFLFSKNQDILNSILANEVEVDGNLNYIFKFGFMARDLFHRIGIEQTHDQTSSNS